MNAPKTVRRAFRGLVGLPTDEAPTPTAVPPPASTQAAPELQCDYRCVQGTPPWVCLCCRHIATDDDMTAAGAPASRVCSVQNIARENQAAAIKQSDKKSAERERRAAAGREKRKIKRDQLAAIKAALRTPVAVIISEADKKRQEEKLEARMSRRPKIEVSGGGYLEQILTVSIAPTHIFLNAINSDPGVGGRGQSPQEIL